MKIVQKALSLTVVTVQCRDIVCIILRNAKTKRRFNISKCQCQNFNMAKQDLRQVRRLGSDNHYL